MREQGEWREQGKYWDGPVEGYVYLYGDEERQGRRKTRRGRVVDWEG